MKYLTEYRDAEKVKVFLDELHAITTRPWQIMEVCGGQTHGLVRNGILDLLPEKVTMVHGPGCPVCVTPVGLIDKAIHLAQNKDVILCSFGDMVRVPGSEMSLLQAKAEGADIRMLYSPLEAVRIAAENPSKQVVFFAVGFETTAPANALAVLHAAKSKVENFSLLTSHVLVPPAIRAVMDDEENNIDGFLAAGHVCTVMGYDEYHDIARQYKVPIVVTGFEPVDLLQGILMVVRQLEKGEHKVENQYSRVVSEAGNQAARKTIKDVFRIADREWRGIGEIPESGLELKGEYAQFDANIKFGLPDMNGRENSECIAGDILKGIKKPVQCPQFGMGCTPSTPLGAPMVSSEGACAAYYHFSGVQVENSRNEG